MLGNYRVAAQLAAPWVVLSSTDLVRSNPRRTHLSRRWNISKIHKLLNSVWNKKELPDHWKESITVPVHKKSNRTECNNYCGISLLSTSYKISSTILLSRLCPHTDEIIGDHQCGFQCTRSTTHQIFYIRQILMEKWDYNETVHQLFKDFKRAYDSVRRKLLYNILIHFEVPVKWIRLIKMCLNETWQIPYR
jgi:hypothetical protein